MPFTFAHLADCHLGAFRDPVLRELNVRAFEKALDRCMALNVDFAIIAGDLFEITLPDMSVVDRAVKKLRELKERGIPVYTVFGSHDYSPLETSVIDVLGSAGLIKKVVSAEVGEGNKINLKFFRDEKTGAQITGLSARKGGLEKEYYKNLDTGSLEGKDGVKIFVFHTTINEIRPEFLAVIDGVPLSLFPKNFSYYAGGHIHKRIEAEMESFGKIIYPGPLFGRDYRDLENSGKEPAGFYIASVSGSGVSASFEPVEVCRTVSMNYCADNKTASQARDAAEELVENFEAGKSDVPTIVLFRIYGELSAGKPHEIDFESLKSRIIARGAAAAFINRNSLSAREAVQLNVITGSRREIEERIFKEELAGFCGRTGLKSSALFGSGGAAVSQALLDCMKTENAKESKADYEGRIKKNALSILRLQWRDS